MTVVAENPDALIIGALCEHGTLTRAAVIQATGLSAATVNRSLARLTASGVVRSAGYEPSTGGRPPELFAYNGDGMVVAGASVTDRGVQAVLMSLDGEIVARQAESFGRRDDPETRLKKTLGLLDRTLADPPGRIGGLGVAVPGVVSTSGVVTAIHELEWNRFALRDLLSRHTGMPVVLDNDANCLAVAEQVRGAGQGIDDLVAFVISKGLGAGIIANGQLYRGLHHEAGEIGYLMTDRSSLRRLFPTRGDLEQQVGAERLEREATRLGLPNPDQATLPFLIDLVSQGERPDRELADELLDLTALAIAAICVVLDPELVVIGGTDDEPGMSRVIAGVRERLLGRILRVPRIESAALGADAVMVGAAQLAMPL